MFGRERRESSRERVQERERAKPRKKRKKGKERKGKERKGKERKEKGKGKGTWLLFCAESGATFLKRKEASGLMLGIGP